MPDDLAFTNRRVLAERLRWPAGILQTCEDLEAEHPGWSLWWSPANTTAGFERPAGFVAKFGSEPEVRGGDAAEVRAGIVERVGDPRHTPRRDTYACTVCGQPWPCEPARQHLIKTSSGRPELSMRMTAELEQAVRVVGDLPPTELFDRFLGWTRRV